MTAWTSTELDHEPHPLDSDGTPTGYIQYRNIVHHEAEEGEMGKPEHWTAEMRFISVSEYENLKAIQNIVSGGTEV